MMSSLLLLIVTLFIASSEGVLRPRKAHRSQKHYNKNAIKSHIKAQKLKHVPSRKAHVHAKIESNTADITTATDEMWASCKKQTFTQYLDHFGSGIGPDDVRTFEQRYYICGKSLYNWEPNNPIFFYFGNEADVTAYIDYTGLMWEQAEHFDALLVFAEHRYYGESLPYTQEEIVDDTAKLSYLTTDQALEDYAVLIDYLQKNTFGYGEEFDNESSEGSAIIGFGGSYGGMLGACVFCIALHILFVQG